MTVIGYKMKNVLCGCCKQNIWWDRDARFWCENKACKEFKLVEYNPKFKNP